MSNQQIGPYVIQSHLGSGGMSDVYLAWDSVNRWPVALKLLRAASGKQTKLLKRTEREAALLKKLRHPHIVQVYDADQAPEGYYYIAMEYVAGGDLYDLMRRKPGAKLPATQAVYLMRRVAGAMAYAHGEGVVHRDLKPANILLRADSGEPVVTDLGIAAFAGANPLTGTMESLGTPQYMAPEQAAGKGTADGRADIYAIGVILYELLTGRLPFEAENNWAILLRKQQEAAPPVLSVRRDLNPRLAAVVDTCLQRDPAARYQTAGELAIALDALLPADARPPAPSPVKGHKMPTTPGGTPITPHPSNPPGTPAPGGAIAPDTKRRPSPLLWAGGGALALLLLLALVLPGFGRGGGQGQATATVNSFDGVGEEEAGQATATINNSGGASGETTEQATSPPTSTSAGVAVNDEETPTPTRHPTTATSPPTRTRRAPTRTPRPAVAPVVTTADAMTTPVPVVPVAPTATIVDGDSDGDNVPNSVDQCPYEFQGGIPDPNRPGCPLDSDGDGLMDDEDQCVFVPAPPDANPDNPGCPPDSDADGWLDHDDLCPNENAGPYPDPSRPGCPGPAPYP